MRKIYLVFVFTLFFSLAQAIDCDTAVINPTSRVISLNRCAAVYIDPETVSGIDKIRRLPNSKFESIKDGQSLIHLSYDSHASWIKIKVYNAAAAQNYYLETNITLLNSIGVYVVKDSGEYEVAQYNTHLHIPTFTIPFKANAYKEIYIYIDARGNSGVIDLKLMSNEALIARFANNEFIYVLLYGIISVIFFFNILIFIRTKNESVLFYLLYLLTFGGFLILYDGYFLKYMYPDNLYLNNILSRFLSIISIAFNLLFVQSYLGTKKKLAKTHKFISALILICFLLSTGAFFSKSFIYTSPVVLMLSLVTSVTILATAIRMIAHNPFNAKLYILGYGTLFVSLILITLTTFGGMENDFLRVHALKIGATFELIILTAALVLDFERRQKAMRQLAMERLVHINDLNSKIKEELEREVMLRTSELRAEKITVEIQSTKIKEINKSLTLAKNLLEARNKSVTDSILYAKRLQEALLPSKAHIADMFAEHFLFYKPKDIISGDFYWFQQCGRKLLWAAADSTGHGVPGALISIVGTNALNKIVSEYGIDKPVAILNLLNKLVTQTLTNTEDVCSRDGMDIALCSVDYETMQAEFAGAFNSLYLVRNGEVTEYKGARKSIGQSAVNPNNAFFSHDINLQEGDMLYMCTDGYKDQFGGPAGKKFYHKNIIDLFATIHTYNMDEQKAMLESNFEKWKGELDQIDDVLIIGIRI